MAPAGYKPVTYIGAGGKKSSGTNSYQKLPVQSASLFSKNTANIRRREINQPAGTGNETTGGATLRGTELEGHINPSVNQHSTSNLRGNSPNDLQSQFTKRKTNIKDDIKQEFKQRLKRIHKP